MSKSQELIRHIMDGLEGEPPEDESKKVHDHMSSMEQNLSNTTIQCCDDVTKALKSDMTRLSNSVSQLAANLITMQKTLNQIVQLQNKTHASVVAPKTISLSNVKKDGNGVTSATVTPTIQ